MIAVKELKIGWQGVSGSTKYEVWKDGVLVGSRGSKARTTSVVVDDATLVEIVAQPSGESQGLRFEQVDGA